MSDAEVLRSTREPSIIPRQLPGLLAPARCAWRRPHLVWQLTRQEILNRYRGSILGLLWSFINPFVLLALFTFVFSVIFEARWSTNVNNKAEFALILFAGFIVFWLFSDCLSRAPSLILQNVNFVKKIVFPLEILPWTVMMASLFHTLVAVLTLAVFHLFIFGLPHPTMLLFPVVLFPFVIMTMGFCWFLASLGVFFRDIGHAVGVFLTVAVYTSPIIYPSSAVPENFRSLLYLNPLSFIVEQSREVLLWGNSPNWSGLALYSGIAWIVAWLGFAWFMKTRKGFANVL